MSDAEWKNLKPGDRVESVSRVHRQFRIYRVYRDRDDRLVVTVYTNLTAEIQIINPKQWRKV